MESAERAAPPPSMVPHVVAPIVDASYDLTPESLVLKQGLACIEHFDIPLPLSNPRLLEMFLDRNRASNGQSLGQMAWAGEFVGKWLTHTAQLYRLTKHAELRATVSMALAQLTKYQAADGYLGPFPDAKGSDGLRTMKAGWDSWGHYHICLGCLLWHEATGGSDPVPLAIATKISQLMITTFPGSDSHKFFNQGSLEQNMAILHAMSLMYSRTGDPKLLTFCKMVVQELQMPPAGDYVRNALKGQEFYKGSQPRWEALCGIIGFAELFHATGEADLSTAYQQIWWSLCQYERHNQGGMMSGEQARGDPYNTLSEETCCTVTWGAMCVEMLKLTGNSIVADELELSCLNSGLFLLSPSGRWCVYNSMMDGTRSSTMMEISFQCKPASSELSCCSVNGPRMMGLVAEYAVMRLDPGSKSTGYAVNLYSPGSVTVSYPKGDGHVVLTQKTTYPLDSKVELTVEPSSGSPTFTLWLRIPAWSEKTTVAVNGTQSSGVTAGKYFAINRAWKAGDKIDIVFDFRLRAWVQPFGPSSSPSDSELEQPSGNFCVPCATEPDAPKPLWSSAQAGWPLNGKAFSGITQTAVGGTTKAFGSGPTTMMGWICSAGGEGVPFSIGAKMGTGGGSDDCRALGVLSGNANYYMRTTPYDSMNIISTASEQAKWSAAMKDGHYHHVAVADTGSQFTLYLDGVALSSGKHAKKPNTVGGFVVGGWADENRRFTGALAGVQFFGSSLAASDISAAMKATAPPQPDKPPRPPQLVKGCLYRGPLLLGFDPCFNPTVDTMPALNLEDLTFEQVTEESWLPPTLLLEFTAADKKTKVRLANYGSLGLRGQAFQTWLPLGSHATDTMPKNIPHAPFSKENPTRTFFVENVKPPAPLSLEEVVIEAVDEPTARAIKEAGGLPTKLLGGDGQPSRRARITADMRIEQLRSTLGVQDAKLQYMDDEGDWVELELEAELAEAKRIAQAMTPPMLKIRAA